MGLTGVGKLALDGVTKEKLRISFSVDPFEEEEAEAYARASPAPSDGAQLEIVKSQAKSQANSARDAATMLATASMHTTRDAASLHTTTADSGTVR